MEAVAKLKNYPTSPRKMRLLADLIRGEKVDKVLAELEHNPKHPAVPLRKLVVKTIFVDGARTLKRMRPAPQGRGYRVRKRSNHVTVIVDTKAAKVVEAPAEAVETNEETAPKPKAKTTKAKTTKKASAK